MTTRRRTLAHSVPFFGCRVQARSAGDEQSGSRRLADDLRLFALTFAGGFLFVLVYLA